MPQIGQDLYDELVELLEDQQDADCVGDPPSYKPNRAMSLLLQLTGTTRESAGEGSAVRQPNEDSSHLERTSPKTPYGLALDLAWDIVQRDDEANKKHPKSLRPGLTDEYTLAKHFLIAQEYISTLKNDLEEAEMNCEANAKDASALRDSRRKLLDVCHAVAYGYSALKSDESLETTARKLYESLTMLPV